MINTDQAIFDAIAAATDHNDDGIFVDVQKFINTFNNHRDRKLCTSLDVAQTPCGECHLQDGEVCDICSRSYGLAQKASVPVTQPFTGTEEAMHYLGAIKVRLELLYEHSTQDARLLEHLSDEIDWVDAEIDRLRSGGVAQASPDQFMDDYKRDTTNAVAARILELEALLSAAQTPEQDK